jgi:hypothetical protein
MLYKMAHYRTIERVASAQGLMTDNQGSAVGANRGAPARRARVEKYNRLLRIEQEPGEPAAYTGRLGLPHQSVPAQ